MCFFFKYMGDTSYAFQTPCSGNSAHPAMQRASVMGYFQHLYWTAAESMPTRLLNLLITEIC
jgi:hypothetical protein